MAGGLRAPRPAPRPADAARRCRTGWPTGIELRDVTFRYPGTGAAGARRRLAAPAGRHGRRAGRRERRRQDDAGQAAVPLLRADGGRDPGRRRRPARASPVEAWRARHRRGVPGLRAASSSSPRETVGVGDLPRLDDAAGGRGRARRGPAADDVPPALPRGLETQLGTSWEGGVELSGGQWQKLALGRAMMRDDAAAGRLRRADRRARRPDRARPVRALRRGGRARGASARARSRCWSPTASRPCAWPT